MEKKPKDKKKNIVLKVDNGVIVKKKKGDK